MLRTLVPVILALFTLVFPAGATAQVQSRDLLPLMVFFRGVNAGNEQVVVERTPAGWTVSSTGRLTTPVELTLRSAKLEYDAEWAPRSLAMQGTLRGIGFEIRTTISGDKADVVSSQGTNSGTKQDAITPGAALLPNNVYGAYVGLGHKVVGLEAGAKFRVYVAPQAEIGATLISVEMDRLKTVERSFDVRKHKIAFENPTGALPVDLWTEPDGRLVRIAIESAGLEVTRQDVAAISTRREKSARPGDQEVMIPANGFGLAATISQPRPPAGGPPPKKYPAVVLVAGSGAQDRDEFVAGIPIFEQLAAALADGGYLVARYDKRGVGQSGGRPESAVLTDYAEDALAVYKYLSRRKDVDTRRITLVGHSEGGWVSLIAAAHEDKIWKVVLCAAPATTGDELVLEQQAYVLRRMNVPSNEVDAKVALQKRVNSAVMSGTSWEGVDPAVRRQANTPWFASFLKFSPADVMRDVRQPLLILQGALDRQVPEYHAEKLADLARGRKKDPGVEVVTIPGANHLFVPAGTGDVEEYATLEKKTIDAQLPAAILRWLPHGVRK